MLGLIIYGTLLLIIVLLIVPFVLLFHKEQIAKRDYLVKHPPLSDEEFVQRCGENVPPEVALKVRRMISDFSGMDYEHIYPETRLFEDLDLC
ncbi:hypothetical protein [uncultured Rubinisphaera sp.]|uniref:hypothetical protein n=1 Tax=uncultured Rubinisphaera sp. TaxID=1678686 RepID=UPI0030DCCB06|tara:strand:+ start:66 stop:341 length:276 start_codon:yes stop_codon:yes gene_type:complete